MAATPAPYRGRFAPTPSGPLHLGSMVAAVGSYLDARSHGGEWLLRIDDLDAPRVVPGAVDAILRSLEAFGLHWDGPVACQGGRAPAYAEAVARLQARGLVFACACSRKEIEGATPGIDGPVYPGTCREGLRGRAMRSLRLRVDETPVEFTDVLQGKVRQSLAADVGDFVLWRSDGTYAYHLACVLDDAQAGITHVVRGADLLASTPRQIYLQRLLDLPTPEYLHLPVAINAAGEKLSKQTLAPAADASRPQEVLVKILRFLGQRPPAGLETAGPADVLDWAVRNWRRDRLPATRSLPAPV